MTLAILMAAATVAAQPPADDARSDEPSEAVVGDATETIYLLDRDGELVFVPDLRLEELMNLRNRKRDELPARAPAYTIDEISVNGQANANTADLTVTYQITITAAREEAVPVRLGLGGGVLRLPVNHRGEGRQYISYQGGGYVCWLNAKADTKHSLTVRWAAPLGKISNAQRLHLQLPPARTELEMRVLAPQATPSVNDQRFRVTGEPVNATHTKITGGGLGGDLQIDWRRGAGPVAPAPAFLSATANITIDIKNRHEIHATAAIEVRSSGRSVESFQVRLPAGMESPRATGECMIADTRTETLGNETVNTVRIRMNDPTQRIANVELTCQLNRKQQQVGRPLQVLGFDVLEAEYQLGDVTLLAAPEWTVAFTDVKNVRRVRSPGEHPRSDEVLAKFEIVERPSSLQISVRKRRSRIQITPTYYLDIRDDAVVLELKLKNAVGRQGYDIDLPLGDWKPLQLTPASLASDGALEVQGGALTIPLSRLPPPPNGEVEVRLRAEQLIPDMSDPITIALPRPVPSRFAPEVDVDVLPAKLVVGAANNVAIVPNLEEAGGLTPLPFDDDAPMDWANRSQTPLIFRSTSTQPAFSARREIRPQTIVTDITGTIAFTGEQMIVAEQFKIDVQYVPAKTIRFIAPQEALQSERFAVMLDSRVLPTAQLDDSEMEEDRTSFAVTLPNERHGEIDIVVRYSLPTPEATDLPAAISTGLVLTAPSDNSTVRSMRLDVSHPTTEKLTLATGPWTTDSAVANGSSQFTVQLDSAAAAVEFQRQRVKPVQGTGVVVKHAWLQTWLTTRRRRDRATFRVETSNQRLTLRLPAGFDTAAWRVAIDGKISPDAKLDEQKQVVLPVPDSDDRRVHLIEVWCQSGVRPIIGSMSLDTVTMVDVNRTDMCQWHLVTPGVEHLLAAPGDLTPELRWRRVGIFWERQSSQSQVELEQLAGATSSPAPSGSENHYLFSSFAPIQRVHVHTVRRGVIVFCSAGVILLLGLAWLNFRFLRRPSAYIVTAVAMGSGAALAPGWGFVVLQASGIGLILFAFAGLWRWSIWRDGQEIPIWVGGDADEEPRSDSTPSHATTATAPAAPLASDSNA
ncbi:MAG: hypothetical protein QGG36_18735 [Pirellulaceae bacterium]|nr:hypothetical protein [Pirellulaceae bacterium]